ncbi:hypothetical protein CAEBREN_22553 [Caenorhabditis brenneri]|uniref:Uncharacterized protein n=1 Tax=Caenorhabditis brenneri TaxID=135651 RepID=G0N1N5_CAEBE|nr:hypothetical protein CAEBREN_22553 [Caenorhabditis brenneri]
MCVPRQQLETQNCKNFCNIFFVGKTGYDSGTFKVRPASRTTIRTGFRKPSSWSQSGTVVSVIRSTREKDFVGTVILKRIQEEAERQLNSGPSTPAWHVSTPCRK